VSSLDWQGRQAKFITRLPDGGIEQILEKLSTLLR